MHMSVKQERKLIQITEYCDAGLVKIFDVERRNKPKFKKIFNINNEHSVTDH